MTFIAAFIITICTAIWFIGSVMGAVIAWVAFEDDRPFLGIFALLADLVFISAGIAFMVSIGAQL